MIELQMAGDKPLIGFDVVLMGLNWYREKDPRIPLGLSMIGAFLLKNVEFELGRSLHFVNYDVRENLSTAIHEVLEIDPKILGIGVYVWNTKEVSLVISGLRDLGFEGIIVLGGPEITYGGSELKREYPGADYYVRGDGEGAFLDIVLHEGGLVRGLGAGIFTETSPVFDGYSTIDDKDFVSPFQSTLLQDKLIGDEFTRWQTQRGCLYRCSFCAFPNGYVRMVEMDVERVRADLEVFSERGVREVAVLDPVFFVHKNRAMRILRLIEEVCPDIRFEVQTKLEHLDDELMDMISRLNIFLECGIQTLDPAVQREIKRVNNRDRIERNLGKLCEYGIEFEVHLIYGLPEQTIDSLIADYQFLSRFTENIRLFPLIRLRGTGLDLTLEDSAIVFSPIFPREVIRTRWMDQGTIFSIKTEGIWCR